MNRPRQLGTKWETAVAAYLRPWWPTIERRALAGVADRGDFINGPTGWTLEAKNTARIDLPGFMREAAAAARTNGHDRWALIVKSRLGPTSTGNVADGYVVIPLHIAAEMWSQLEQP